MWLLHAMSILKHCIAIKFIQCSISTIISRLQTFHANIRCYETNSISYNLKSFKYKILFSLQWKCKCVCSKFFFAPPSNSLKLEISKANIRTKKVMSTKLSQFKYDLPLLAKTFKDSSQISYRGV